MCLCNLKAQWPLPRNSGTQRDTFPKVLDQRPQVGLHRKEVKDCLMMQLLLLFPAIQEWDQAWGQALSTWPRLKFRKKASVVCCFDKILLFWKNLELGAFLRECICSALWFVGAGESHRISMISRERSIWKELFQHSHSLRKTTLSKLR